MNKIVFTGGGTAGHVNVNLALIPQFQKEGWSTQYIGSAQGIEKQLISGLPNVPYHVIATGKLRRYFDWNNIKDPFRVVKGAYQAYRILKKEKPDIVFSKGGFVSVPVVIGAWMNRIPVIIHESDMTPGLANRISVPFASKVCTTFPETVRYLKGRKTQHIGAVIRKELQQGSAHQGLLLCNFVKSKPVLLIMGGSQGSGAINRAVRACLPQLLEQYQIVHLCGKGNIDVSLHSRSYVQYEYITDELPDILAMASLVISRAGSNSIFELLSLRIPMLLIPLSRQASRGDQILNAQSFQKAGYAEVLEEETLTAESLLDAVQRTFLHRQAFIERMQNSPMQDTLSKLSGVIRQSAKKLKNR